MGQTVEIVVGILAAGFTAFGISKGVKARKAGKDYKALAWLLLAVGLALGFLAMIIYPSGSTDVFTPPYSQLLMSATIPVDIIDLTVTQVSPDLADMKISVYLPLGKVAPPGAGPAKLVVDTPPGTAFGKCAVYYCYTSSGTAPHYSIGVAELTFSSTGSIMPTGKATADFFVKAHSFGVASNGITASAAIPEVEYQGPGQPTLVVTYHIPSAASYDWSSFPTASVSNSTAEWQEDLTNDETEARAAVGINHAGQAAHDYEAFVAGALVGVAGGALVSAFQEALQ